MRRRKSPRHWKFTSGGCRESLDATLIDGALQVSGVINAGGDSDFLQPLTVTGTLCVIGSPPPLELVDKGALTPLDAFQLRSSAPLDGNSTVTARRGDAAIKLRVTMSAFTIDVSTPVTGLDATPITLDLSGVRDIIGRAVAEKARTVSVINPTTLATDLTFDTPPPSGAVVGSAAVKDGVLKAEYGTSLLAFDGSGRHLRIRSRLRCDAFRTRTATVVVIAADGTQLNTSPKCETEFSDEVIALSGTGPWRLAMKTPLNEFPPCTGPGYGGSSDTYFLDELTFEP